MKDETKNVAEPDLLRTQRARLARRLMAPWWYVAGVAFAWTVAFSMPIASHYLKGGGIGGAVLAVVVLFLLQYALARVSGVDVGMDTWHYPSGRAWTIAVAMVVLAASVVESLLLEHGLLVVAITVAALATLVGTVCWQGHLRGVRQDLETGRGAV